MRSIERNHNANRPRLHDSRVQRTRFLGVERPPIIDGHRGHLPLKENAMKKFLVLYRMDIEEMKRMMANTTPEQRKKGMAEWDAWMKKKAASFADRGGPAGKTKEVAASGV